MATSRLMEVARLSSLIARLRRELGDDTALDIVRTVLEREFDLSKYQHEDT